CNFYHVFLNLIKKAIEAMPLGRVLRVLTQVKGGKIEVAISDTGVGIPEHLRKKLFKPFFTTKGKDGTGLGLALSKEIVERYGGTISFESKTENGSTFSVIIPTI
ncbi:MAG TPA: sensor histidine kinase, partial [Candidatus Hypogeohydataceae bacterium YC40]